MQYQRQLRFDFEDAELPPAPPEVQQLAPPSPLPLVRPDRQLLYGGTSHYTWPSPTLLHDRDTITVDRIHDDIDGPSHRFVIRRGDTVEVYFSHTKQELGEVTGISHARSEVRVAFGSAHTGGVWFDAAQLYPAPELKPEAASEPTVPLSRAVAAASSEPQGGFAPEDELPARLPKLPAAVQAGTQAVGESRPELPSIESVKQQVLRHLALQDGEAVRLSTLRKELGYPELPEQAAEPLAQAVAKLQALGRVHADTPRFGELELSLLTWPSSPEQWSTWNYPSRLSGAELTYLMARYKVTIKELSSSMQITQKRIRQVRERGIEGSNTVRDWAEAIIGCGKGRGEDPPAAQEQVECSTASRAAPSGLLLSAKQKDFPLTGRAEVLPNSGGSSPHLEENTLMSTTNQSNGTVASFGFAFFWQRVREGHIDAAEFKAEFATFRAARADFVSHLIESNNAKDLALYANRVGILQARSNTKQENAAAIYRSLLSQFTLSDSVRYSPLSGETYEDALAKQVEQVTDASLTRYLKDLDERQAARDKAFTNPETLAEFRTFLSRRDESQLSDKQLAAYDRLEADRTRGERAARSTVQQFTSPEADSLELRITEGYHSKRDAKLWIVQLGDRVERGTFNELKLKAKQLGGWWSSFVKAQAGFQFLSKESAEKFAGLLSGDADRSDELAARKGRREQSAAERLHELADTLLQRSEEAVERSHNALQNTARRAHMQAGVRGRAYADQALARSLHSIAGALFEGNARYLDGIRHKTHIETLDTVLTLAKWARIRELQKPRPGARENYYARLDQEEQEPANEQHIRFAAYPFPSVYRRHLEDAIQHCRTKPGMKLVSNKMAKRLARMPGDYVTFSHAVTAEELSSFVSGATSVGFDTERLEMSLENFKRLRRANIYTLHELRAALREYLPHKATVRGDDPVLVAERELIGKPLPGFFPTPTSVSDRMLELLELLPQHLVLEPSCGKGDLLDAIRRAEPGVQLTAIELNRSLADVLAAKGYDVRFEDFLHHQGAYDRIIMNPPFEHRQDIMHVEHAFSLLRPGGILVSVMSEGSFFRYDSQKFRDWLEQQDHDVQELPEDAFAGADAFRKTQVRTRLVTIRA